MFRKGRREGRGTYAFANGAIYEGRFIAPGFSNLSWFKMFYDSSKDGWHQRLCD